MSSDHPPSDHSPSDHPPSDHSPGDQRAIVIGLNRYKLAGYDLTAPVRDALRFAAWVTQPGRVPRNKTHLHLLLSPSDADDLGAFAPLMEQATDLTIKKWLLHYAKQDVEKPKRLWIFFAGHAIAPHGSNAAQAPQLIPPDIGDMSTIQTFPLSFNAVVQSLLMQGPDEQVIFVDACRKPLPSDTGSHGTIHMFFDSRQDSPEPRTQALLYGTTHGRLANQVGTGLFSEALHKGLQGRAELEPIPFEDNRFRLRFPKLSAYVESEVPRLAENANLVQVPQPADRPPMILAEFDGRPKARVTLHVKPQAALTNASVGIQTPAEGRREKGPPAEPPLRWEVSLGQVAYRVIAEGFSKVVEETEVYEDVVLPVRLSRSNLESVRGGGRLPPVIPDDQAKLSLLVDDRLVSHAVINDQGTLVASGDGSADHDLKTGVYRVQWMLPGSGVVSDVGITLMPEGHTEEYQPQPTCGPLPGPLVDSLNMAGIDVTGAATFPSEAFGFATAEHFGSLLSWAADAARYPGGDGDRLRSLGVEAVDTAQGSSWLQVLVGDAGVYEHPILHGLKVRFGQAGVETPIDTTEVPGLAGFACQAQSPVSDDGASLIISGPRVSDIALPVPHVTGCISVVIMARDPDGQIEVHRYLHEAEPQRPFSDMIRVREQQWRALERRTPISDDEAQSLLNDESIDPLTRIVVGYRLWQAGKLDLWFDLIDVDELRQIPDMAILTGLHEGSDEAAINRALNSLGSGLPLLGIGFQTLHRWLQQNARRNGLPPPLPLRSPVPGATWTIFDARTAEAPVATSDAIPASVLSQHPAPWINRIEHVVEATGRIDLSAAKQLEIKGTALRVAPSVLLTMSYLFDSVEDGTPADDLDAWLVRFSGQKQSALGQILGRSEGGHRWGNKLLTACFVQTEDREALPIPLSFSFEPPLVGQRIVVVGFPKASGPLHQATTRAFANEPIGQKYVLPGEITRVGPDIIEYAACTLGGTSGGPVVNLDTGDVIGVHFGGRFDEATGIKYGMGLPLSRTVGEPFWSLLHD